MSDRAATGTGVLTNGKIDWDDGRAFTADLRALGSGPIIARVERASRRAIRSYQMNKYLWGHVYKLMTEETQHSKDDLHDLMCDRFLKHRVAIVNKDTGAIEERDVAGRSSTLDPDTFWDFVMQVRLFAAEFLGITTQDPDPHWRERDREDAA